MPLERVKNPDANFYGKVYVLPDGGVHCACCGAVMNKGLEKMLNEDADVIATRPYVSCPNQQCYQANYRYYFPITTLRAVPEYRKAADDPARA